MNPEDKPPSFKVPGIAWGRFALCPYQNRNPAHCMPCSDIVRILALTWKNKYIFHGMKSGEGVHSDYFGNMAVTPFISDDIKYRVVD